MLVLSRRPDEKIVLPTVPAVIKVISSQAGLVRLGIDAPADVPILREELTQDEAAPRAPKPERVKTNHALRNRLNNLTLALTLLRMKLPDATPAVLATLAGIEEELQALKRLVAPAAAAGTHRVAEPAC